MNKPVVTERQTWFRFFPEGSVEFLVVTRVLALLMLAALIVVRSNQRPLVLVALVALLWLDYLLMLWWAIQVTTDLDDLFSEPQPGDQEVRYRRVRVGLQAALPSAVAVVVLAPWPALMGSLESSMALGHLGRWVTVPVFGVLFVVALFFAQRALQRVRLGRPGWTLLFLIPVLHWFAMHRLLLGLEARFQQRCGEQGQPPGDDLRSGLALVLADVSWVLSVLPWGMVVVWVWWRGSWPAVAPGCGTLLAGLFAVADLAALEQLHRRLVGFIQKL